MALFRKRCCFLLEDCILCLLTIRLISVNNYYWEVAEDVKPATLTFCTLVFANEKARVTRRERIFKKQIC